MIGNSEQNEREQAVVDVRITSNDGRIDCADVYEDGSTGPYQYTGHDTDTSDMGKVMRDIREQRGLPSAGGE